MKFDHTPNGRSAGNGAPSENGGGGQFFAHRLRALGQALEKFGFSAFDIELQSGIYLVSGRAGTTENVKLSFLRLLGDLFRRTPSRGTLSDSDNRIDLRFSADDIERFDVRGRIKRQDGEKMPDPYSISQILRGTGCFLDHREGTRLVGVSLKGKWVTLRYQTAAGRVEQAQQDLDYFYDYWVKMYLRRSNRAKLAASSDPAVLMAWGGIKGAPIPGAG